MPAPAELPDDFRDLVDAYCDGLLDEDGLRRLESILLGSEPARRDFARYVGFHADLALAVRRRREAGAVATPPLAHPRPGRRVRRVAGAIAAGALIAAAAYALGQSRRSPTASAPDVAWLVNAQGCEWEDGGMTGRDLAAGRSLRLRRGLAEFEFAGGARVILQGPASLELISAGEARLVSGSLTARVPHGARGFTVHAPGGKVVDLGTEFGLAVDESGGSALRVFDGEVEAVAGEGRGARPAVRVVQDQAARINGRSVDLADGPDAGRFVREIAAPRVLVSRTATLSFENPVDGTIRDARGRGVGLTHRLPGTGVALPADDPNLRLNPSRGALELTTTSSDVNTQFQLDRGEYLGFRLADLGFTGVEDFEIVATLPDIPALDYVGQFGLYVGVRGDRVFRGGLIRHEAPEHYSAFLVNNDGGVDADLEEIGLTNIGDDLRLVLRRVAGAYSLVVENLTLGSSNTLAIAHPGYLDGERDLFVGLFGASPKTEPKTLNVRQVGVTVLGLKDGTPR